MPNVTGVSDVPSSLTDCTLIRYVWLPAAGSCRQGEPDSVRKSPTAIGADDVAFTVAPNASLSVVPLRATTNAAPGATQGTVNCTLVALALVTTARAPFTNTLVAAVKSSPLIVAAAPGTSGVGVTPLTVGFVPVAFTVTVTASAFPSIVAVIVEVPAATPVTRPDWLTVATPLLLDVQAAVLPFTVPPALFRAVACSCTSSPTAIAGSSGVTWTDSTRFVSGPVPESPHAARKTAASTAADRR